MLKRQINELKNELKKLIESNRNGTTTREDFITEYRRISEQISLLEFELAGNNYGDLHQTTKYI